MVASSSTWTAERGPRPAEGPRGAGRVLEEATDDCKGGVGVGVGVGVAALPYVC